MKMVDNWFRMRQYETKITTLSVLGDKDPSADDAFFEVMECGPDVERVRRGDIVVASFAQGMFRFQVPGDSFKSFALRDSEVIGIISP